MIPSMVLRLRSRVRGMLLHDPAAKRFHRNGRPIYSDVEPSDLEEE